TKLMGSGSSFALWTDQDLGSVGITGSAAFDGTTFTIKASGGDIDNQFTLVDGMHFVYRPLSGDGSITARLASVRAGRVGLMLRETLDPAARNAFVGIEGGGVLKFLARTTPNTGVPPPSGIGISAPTWLRLVRQGTNITAYNSSDGVTWTLTGTATI